MYAMAPVINTEAKSNVEAPIKHGLPHTDLVKVTKQFNRGNWDASMTETPESKTLVLRYTGTVEGFTFPPQNWLIDLPACHVEFVIPEDVVDAYLGAMNQKLWEEAEAAVSAKYDCQNLDEIERKFGSQTVLNAENDIDNELNKRGGGRIMCDSFDNSPCRIHCEPLVEEGVKDGNEIFSTNIINL